MNIRFPLILLLLAAPVQAENAIPVEKVELTIHPAATTQPALRYRLLPDPADETPGNAATVYMTALVRDRKDYASDELFKQLAQSSIADLPADKTEAFLRDFTSRIAELDVAGRRSWCEWDMPIREEGFATACPYLGQARPRAEVLSINTKLAIKQHRYDEAVHSLQTGMALARNLQHNSPMLVQFLVGMGVEKVMLQDVRQFIQQRGAPNLYWPLANLPPMGNDRVRVVQADEAILFLARPELKHAERLSAEQCRKILDELAGLVMVDEGRSNLGNAALPMQMIGVYPAAKQWLVERGMSAEEVGKLAANAVVLAYWVEQYERQRDEWNKWMGLPIYQGYPALMRSERRSDTHNGNPFMAMIYASGRWLGQCGDVEQQQAMLQIVEGLRAYAATHNGSLPASLDDMAADTPAVIDPMSGQPFAYALSGNTATLGGAPTISNGREKQWIYHITLEP